MKWRAAVCGLLISAVGSANADDALRDQVLRALSTQPQRHFSFVQEKKLAVLANPLITEGEMLIAGEHDITWDIRKPYVMRYEIHGEHVRETDENGTRVIAIGGNPLASALAEAMATAFSGHWRAQDSITDVHVEGSLQQWQIHITPRKDDFKKIIARIDAEGSAALIHSVKILESNGDSTLIRLQVLPSPVSP